MGLLGKVAIILSSAAFIAGFFITLITGSVRPVKIFLAILGCLGIVLAIIALVVSRGFVYLLFQYIVVVIILLFIVIAGAVCGGGVYTLIHRKTPGLQMNSVNIEDFLPLDQFIALEGISKEKALARISSGYYEGGKSDGVWYIRKSELSITD